MLSAGMIFQNSTFTGAGDLFTSEETDTGIMDIIDTPDSESGSADDLDVYESFDYSQEEDICSRMDQRTSKQMRRTIFLPRFRKMIFPMKSWSLGKNQLRRMML